MAKSSKKSKEATAPEVSSNAPGMESSNGHSAAQAAKPPAVKKSAAKPVKAGKRTAKPRQIAVKRAAGTRSPRAKKTAEAASSSSVTDEQVRIRAYFISEWRIQNGIAGDSANDWLEARRQLQREAAAA